jgi:hypothetical protein
MTQTATQTTNNQHSGGRPQGPRILPFVDREQRDQNRQMPAAAVLHMLKNLEPAAYDLAEQVGAWIWITFPDAPSEHTRGQLSQLGFHWNNVRKCWQHPCGQFATQGSTTDPRQKYGSRFAADLQAA